VDEKPHGAEVLEVHAEAVARVDESNHVPFPPQAPKELRTISTGEREVSEPVHQAKTE
jgi:hypothetical protein